MNQVSERTSIAGIVLENRIIRSATLEGMGDDAGYPKDELMTIYERLAENKVGAIITGYVTVQRNGRTVPTMCIFDDDKYIDNYKKICAAVYELFPARDEDSIQNEAWSPSAQNIRHRTDALSTPAQIQYPF